MSCLVNPYVFASSQDPGDITGLTMWVAADDPLLSGLSDGAAVGGTTVWTDLVTGSRNFAQATSGNRPVYKVNIVNGEPVIRFDATDDTLDYSVAASNILGASAFTVFLVIKPDRNGNTSGTEAGANSFTPAFSYIGINLHDSGGGTNKFRFWIFDGAYKGTNSTTTYSLGSWYVVECWYTGSSVNIKVNNDTATSASSGDPQQLTNFPRIGGLTGSRCAGSDIAEILTYNVSLSSTDRTTVRQYLATKYAITLA